MRVALWCLVLVATVSRAEGTGQAPAKQAPLPRLFAGVSFNGLLGRYSFEPTSQLSDDRYFEANGVGLGGDLGVQWLELVAIYARVRSVIAPQPNQLIQLTGMVEVTPLDFLSLALGFGITLLPKHFEYGDSPFAPPPANYLFTTLTLPISVSFNLGTRVWGGHRLSGRLSIEGGLYIRGNIFGLQPWAGLSLGAVFF